MGPVKFKKPTVLKNMKWSGLFSETFKNTSGGCFCNLVHSWLLYLILGVLFAHIAILSYLFCIFQPYLFAAMIGRDEAYESIMSTGRTLNTSWSKKWSHFTIMRNLSMIEVFIHWCCSARDWILVIKPIKDNTIQVVRGFASLVELSKPN